jgi:hypothetical protein
MATLVSNYIDEKHLGLIQLIIEKVMDNLDSKITSMKTVLLITRSRINLREVIVKM